MFSKCLSPSSLATMIDGFSTRYTKLLMTADQLNALYAQLEQEYFGEIDNLGLSYLDDGLDWVDIHHLFECRFCYVEYAPDRWRLLLISGEFQGESGTMLSALHPVCGIPQRHKPSRFLALAGLNNLFEKSTIETLAQNLEAYFSGALFTE